jgi:hypothetical protein
MAVRADDLALRDLREDRRPRPVRERGTDVERLVAEVVELEHHGIGLTAVSARIRGEVLEQMGDAFPSERLLALTHLSDVPASIRDVVLVLVRPPDTAGSSCPAARVRGAAS